MPPGPHVVSSLLKKSPADQYGQEHPIETPDMIQDSMSLLEEEIKKLPIDDREALDDAMERYPDYVMSKEHKLLFLRCEQFNVDLAACRMAKYWQMRVKLFGDDAFSPLTLNGPLQKDEAEFAIGFARLLPGKDETGRSNVFVDPSVIDGKTYSHESMVRATWYCLHAALEEESTQKRGVVFLCYLRDTRYRHFDRVLVQMNADSIRGVLPIGISALHIFQAPALFNVLFEVVKFLLGDRLAGRIKLFNGEDNKILAELRTVGIHADRVPFELGGNLRLDHERWLSDRKAAGK